MKRILPLILALALLFTACAAKPAVKVNTEEFKTNYKFVFVHGLSGWGSYDKRNKYLKYWGMQNGDLLKYLNKQGFDCYSASVAPQGSAWDRACELYAQLTGTVTDYGKAHSERCNHERFGEDFTGRALIDKWDSENKINLLGHSFGGATIRLLSELMKNGSEEERNATPADELSPLFSGGKGDWIYSVTALAAPMNGTTAYDIDNSESVGKGLKSKYYDMLTSMVSSGTKEEDDGRADFDNANYDMLIDNALKFNEETETQEGVYYFSFPCSSTVKQDDGTYAPETDITEPMFVKPATLMGKLTETTPGGVEIGEEWLENDGLVNTVSARAPFGAPQKDYEEGDSEPGIWYVMPTYHGDHMSLQGGFTKKNDVRDFYAEHLTRINKLG